MHFLWIIEWLTVFNWLNSTAIESINAFELIFTLKSLKSDSNYEGSSTETFFFCLVFNSVLVSAFNTNFLDFLICMYLISYPF